MDSDFIPLPNDVQDLERQLAEKEKIIKELLLENRSLKEKVVTYSMEELDVEVDENAETIELKQFEDENGEDDENNPSLGENVNQDDFLNILRMLMSQGTQGTYGSDPSLSLHPSLEQGQEDEEQGQEDEEQGQEDDNIIDDMQVD